MRGSLAAGEVAPNLSPAPSLFLTCLSLQRWFSLLLLFFSPFQHEKQQMKSSEPKQTG